VFRDHRRYGRVRGAPTGGRPTFEPTERDRARVEAFASVGIEHEDVCKVIENPSTGKPIARATVARRHSSGRDGPNGCLRRLGVEALGEGQEPAASGGEPGSGGICVNWKLHTRDEGHIPALDGFHTLDSKEAALDRACDTLMHQLHVKVLFIEGPNGERIERPQIESWCQSAKR
jgi:hypothetical protein